LDAHVTNTVRRKTLRVWELVVVVVAASSSHM
jgi:hypothetical protein